MAAGEMVESAINAIVKDVSDMDLVLEQGRDNSYRRQMSYIEKVRLAGHIFKIIPNFEKAQKQVALALSVHPTDVSRLKVISEKIHNDIIESIGLAPNIGRNRWQNLADLVTQTAHLKTARRFIQDKSFKDLTSSDNRFLHLVKEIEGKPASSKTRALMADNTKLGNLARKTKRSDIQLPDKAFAEFVANKLPELYEAYRKKPEWSGG